MDSLHLILPVHPDGMPDTGLTPSLDKCLARGQVLEGETDLAGVLCRAFGLEKQQDWPIAPLSAALDGLEPGDAYWLRADPVQLEAGMNGLFLRDGLEISPLEAHAFAQALAPYFAEQDVEFAAPHPSRWYLRFPAPLNLATTPLDQVRGRQAMGFLPEGADAPKLMRLINQAQMLLHAHPLNQAREQAGLAPVNSLWPWGGGRPGQSRRVFDAVWGQHPALLALALSSGTPVHPCPQTLKALGHPSRALAVLTPPDTGMIDTDYLAHLEQDWLRPALRGLQLGRIRSVRLSLLAGKPTQTVLRPWQSWRFWR